MTLTFRAAGLPPLGFLRYPLRATPMPDEHGEPAEPRRRRDGCGHGRRLRRRGRRGDADGAELARVCDWEQTDGLTISNDALTVTVDPARGGSLTSVIDRRTGRNLLGGPGNDLVLQEEYEQHPRWGEGPWHLSPKGPGVSSATVPAQVTAQRSPVGSRLVARYQLGDLTITAETILWDGAERVEFRTHVSGSIGRDHLLRVRFPARVAGGLPVYQTATAVIGRPFGAPEADVAQHWWTLDNPANHWFGLGAVARAVLAASSGDVPVALGVAEVITPDVVPDERRPIVKDLVSWLAGAGVTATTSRASGPRYGSVDVDSNLPDFRIALGGPEENAFTSELLTACDPAVAKRLDALLADGNSARLWVPAAQSRAAAFAPSADLRGVRDLPVLIVAAAEPGDLDQALAELRGELAGGSVRADVDGRPGPGGGRARRRRRGPRRRGRRAVQPGHPGRGGHARRDAVDVALPRLRRLAERRLDRRRPAGRAGRLVVRLAALVAHVQLRPRVLGRGGRLARGRVQRGRRGVQPRPDGRGDRADGGRRAADQPGRPGRARSRSKERRTSPSARSSPSAIRSRPAGRERRRPTPTAAAW